VKIRQLFDELKKMGWRLDRIKGSHYVFVHPSAKRSIVVPVHGKELPDFYANSILKQAKAALGDK
jgi:predicted RNA binding protein YcfA (HicA-like mRNA interferase family)